jgi:hypothetical protein
MTISATIVGFQPQEGDRLVAYAEGEEVGSGQLSTDVAADSEPLLYLSISGTAERPIWFAIEREGQIVASTDEQMTFKANAVVGSPDQPTAIDFARQSGTDGQWHTLSGIRLSRRPTATGVYIFNGRKVVVK